MKAPLPNARQEMWMSQILRDDHYKRMLHFTVGAARLRTLMLNDHNDTVAINAKLMSISLQASL